MEKLTKLGITSLSLMALGVVAPVVAPVTFGGNVVYAEEAKPESFEVLVGYFGNTGNNLIDVAPEDTITITPSNPYTVKHPQIDGWEPDKAFLNPIRGEGRFAEEGEVLSYDSFKNDGITDIFNISYTYTPAKTPTETPTQPETPAEQPQTPPEVPATKPAEQPTKPAEEPQDQSRDIYIGYAIYGDVKRPEGLTSETGTIETTATLNPGGSYTFPNVTAPGYKLLGIYDETDKNIGVGGTVNYEDIKYHENLEAYVKQVFYIYEPTSTPAPNPAPAEQPQTPPEVPATKPETPADKPAVIHIGEQPTSPVNDTSLYYTIETQFGDPKDGGWSVEQSPNINVGEIHEVEGLSEKSQPWTTYRIMEGTPESYTITYDDVKAGKTHFVFRLYNTKTHNPDGTPKTEVPATKPETPADKPADQQPLKYRVTWYMNGKVYQTYEWEIEPGETFNKGYYDKGTVPTYGPVDGTPLSHNISYDDVKAGKTNYDFYIYDLKTQNSDGTPKTEVPATKPETPAEKPSDKPVQPAKPVEQPTTPVKPMDKPATKPTDTNKPVVKPADNGRPEVKPENKVEPKAEVKPTQQSGNAAANAQTPAPKADAKAPAAAAPKADKPAEKKMETLPNTGEAQSTLALLGLALGVLGLQGLTYKGRHDRKR